MSGHVQRQRENRAHVFFLLLLVSTFWLAWRASLRSRVPATTSASTPDKENQHD